MAVRVSSAKTATALVAQLASGYLQSMDMRELMEAVAGESHRPTAAETERLYAARDKVVARLDALQGKGAQAHG